MLLICCLKVFELRRPLVVNNFSIGHADSAAYALQGRSLAERGSLDINYITNFYHAYDKEISRHDDHWPPFQAMFYAPAFYFFGSNASVARQCNLFMGAVILPMVSAWFLLALLGKSWICGVMVFVVLSNEFVFKASTGLLADVSHCALLVAYASALISSKRFHPNFLILAGLMGGLAWTCKGSQILLLPFLIFSTFVLHGPRMLRKAPFLLGLLLFLVILAPRAIENVKKGRGMLQSTQNYVSSFFGLEKHPWGNWDQNFYGVYWDESLPSPWERFEDKEKYEKALIGNLRVVLGSVMLGTNKVGRNLHDLTGWEKLGALSKSIGLSLTEEPYHSDLVQKMSSDDRLPWITPIGSWPEGWTALLRMLGFGLGMLSVVVVPMLWFFRNIRESSLMDFWGRSVFVLGILMLMHISFPVIFWYVMPRLVMTVEPLYISLGIGALMGCCYLCSKGCALLWLKIEERRRREGALERSSVQISFLVKSKSFGLRILWVVLGVVIYGQIENWHQEKLKSTPLRIHSSPHYPHYSRVAESMKGVVPETAIVMTRNPWELLFYSPDSMRATGLPYAEPRVILAVAKYYGVTHLMNDRYRPGLKSFLRSRHPGVTQVVSRPQPVYEIDFNLFGPEEIASEEELRGYNREFLLRKN